MDINKKLHEIKARANAATVGPWTTNNTQGLVGGDGKTLAYGSDFDGTVWFDKIEDDKFVTNARLDLPALAEALDEVMQLHVSQFDRTIDADGEPGMYCDHCNSNWPCATIRAIEKGFRKSAVYALMDFDHANGITE